MTKAQGMEIAEFIENHYDCVWQEDWFALCDLLLGVIIHDANQGNWGAALAERFPFFFKEA